MNQPPPPAQPNMAHQNSYQGQSPVQGQGRLSDPPMQPQARLSDNPMYQSGQPQQQRRSQDDKFQSKGSLTSSQSQQFSAGLPQPQGMQSGMSQPQGMQSGISQSQGIQSTLTQTQSSSNLSLQPRLISQPDMEQTKLISTINQQIDLYVQTKLEAKINSMLDFRMAQQGGNSALAQEFQQFRQDISRNINENYEQFAGAIKRQNENLIMIDKKSNDFVQRLNSQIQLQWQEFDKQKLLQKQMTTNIETKITEFENFIRISGGGQQNQNQRRNSNRRGSDIHLDGDDKLKLLQSDLEAQKAVVDQLQKSFSQVVNSSQNQAQKLTRRLSNIQGENLNIQNVSKQKHYKLDKNNYLIDNEGNFIVSESGKMVQLSAEQVKLLHQNSILK